MISTADFGPQVEKIEQTDVIVMHDVSVFGDMNTDIVCPYMTFMLIHRGSDSGLYDLQPITQRENELACILPGHIIHPISCSADFCATVMLISQRLLKDLQYRVFSHDYDKFNTFPICTLTETEARRIMDFVEQLEAVLRHTDEELPHRYDMLIAILSVGYEYLNYYRREQDKVWEDKRHNEMLNQFCELVVEHYKESREVSFYANMFKLSPKYFSKRICSLTGGLSPADWIERYVAAQAKHIIRTQRPTVKEAAYALGFNEASSFCRFFKRVTGQTPQQFRAGLDSL
jgi:AraC-like DNA-binding protein